MVMRTVLQSYINIMRDDLAIDSLLSVFVKNISALFSIE